MQKSAAFVRIKEQVLLITDAIPEGRLCTFHSIGEHLDVMPRHVAYILSQLDDAAKMAHPWHRVVASDGSLGVLKRAPSGETQAELLALENVAVAKNAVMPNLESYFVPAAKLRHGIPRLSRPRLAGQSGDL
jgi:methylated-DNA-protein-cysteine methyltransferase related protein